MTAGMERINLGADLEVAFRGRAGDMLIGKRKGNPGEPGEDGTDRGKSRWAMRNKLRKHCGQVIRLSAVFGSVACAADVTNRAGALLLNLRDEDGLSLGSSLVSSGRRMV